MRALFRYSVAALSLLAPLALLATAGCDSPDTLEEESGLAPESVLTAPTAGTVLVSCSLGRSDSIYTPGLQLLPRQVEFEDTASTGACITSHPSIHSGVLHATGRAQQSCSAANMGESEGLILWDNGSHSDFTFQVRVDAKPGASMVVTHTGTVIDGEFVGAEIVQTMTLGPAETVGCWRGTGARHASGAMTLLVKAPRTPRS
jgi:hypothetical protein